MWDFNSSWQWFQLTWAWCLSSLLSGALSSSLTSVEKGSRHSIRIQQLPHLLVFAHRSAFTFTIWRRHSHTIQRPMRDFCFCIYADSTDVRFQMIIALKSIFLICWWQRNQTLSTSACPANHKAVLNQTHTIWRSVSVWFGTHLCFIYVFMKSRDSLQLIRPSWINTYYDR